MNTQTTISKVTRKYLDIIASGVIEESQIISMKSLMGRDKEAAKAIFEALDISGELELSSAQQTQGFDFLKNAWKTPRGIERKNNPFGYREQEILKNGTDISLKGFYDASTYGGTAFYIPIYSVNSKGGSFEYYYNGEINIIG